MESLKRLYARLRTWPFFGAIVTLAVRTLKRILGLPTARVVDRIDVLTAALSGAKTKLDHQERLLSALRKELDEQKLTIDLLITAQQARGLSIKEQNTIQH